MCQRNPRDNDSCTSSDDTAVVAPSVAQAAASPTGPLSPTITTTGCHLKRNKKSRLEQLDGFRFLVALWLVVAHNFSPKRSPRGGLLERFCMRRYVAVTFFIVLSGFVSHYAYRERTFFHPDRSIHRETLRRFYMGRIGPVLACYYATMAASVLIRGMAGHFVKAGGWRYAVKGSLLSLCLLQSWFPSYAYFGNTPAWTLATLVWHWAAYPWLQPNVKNASTRALVFSLGILPILAMLPACLTIALYQGGYLARPQKMWYTLYTFPVFRFSDFAFGTVLCELFQRKEHTAWRHTQLAKWSDLALPAVLGLILAVPYSKRFVPYDILLVEATVPLFGFLIYMSSCHPRGSLSGYLMSLEVCQQLGNFAFQVYLWRWPLFALVSWYQVGKLKKGFVYLQWWPEFLPSLVALYLLSYLWYRFVDTPIRLYFTPWTKLTEEETDGALSSKTQLLSDHLLQQPPLSTTNTVSPPIQLTNSSLGHQGGLV